MERRKNAKYSAETIAFQIPADNDLQSRIKKISAQTGLVTLDLFLKWVLQEESLLGLMRSSKSPATEEPQISTFPDSFPQNETSEINPSNSDYRKMLIERVKSLKKEGMTLNAIAEIYNKEKLPTVSGRGTWYSSSIINLLKSNA
jgi:hypothetical protein